MGNIIMETPRERETEMVRGEEVPESGGVKLSTRPMRGRLAFQLCGLEPWLRKDQALNGPLYHPQDSVEVERDLP